MRILVTGCRGQVVSALVETARTEGIDIVTLGRPVLDLAQPEGIAAAIYNAKPDAVISAAAYTAVDKAEEERDLAFAINAAGPRALARAAADLAIPLVHLSTDYVFNGWKSAPYIENDPVAPLGVYGASKLEGERHVLKHHPWSVILRTSWVYAPIGSNFVRTMINIAETRDVVKVVSDQHGAPTSALDIAPAVVAIVRRMTQERCNTQLCGLFHMTAAGVASWADFAEEIFSVLRSRGRKVPRVERIAAAEFVSLAKRPFNSRLDCSKLARVYGIALPDWRQSLARVLDRLL
jgi:dTDP-4-dehydrorhamnose reductase